MPGVLVDVPVVTVSLVGATSPQVVQIAVVGLTAGQTVTVTGSAAGATWEVRGGAIVALAGQVVLTDVLAPLNTPITYTANVDGVDLFSDPVTVVYAARYVLQSLDGRTVIPIRWRDNADPRDFDLRVMEFGVPGRDSPVIRWDTAGGESRSIVVQTTRSATHALREHLFTSAPILVLRTDGSLRDFEPATHVSLRSAGGELFGTNGDRLWVLRGVNVDDPEPSVIIAASTVADFNAVYAAATIADFNAEWVGSTIAEFNRVDWTAH